MQPPDRVSWRTFQGEEREGRIVGVLERGKTHEIQDGGRTRCMGCSHYDRVLVCIERGGKGCEFYAPVAHFVNIPQLNVQGSGL